MYNIKSDQDLEKFLEYWIDVNKFLVYPINSTFDNVKRTEIRVVLPSVCDDEFQFFQEVISKFVVEFHERLNNKMEQ